MAKIKFYCIVTSMKANFLFCPLDASSIFIQKLTVRTNGLFGCKGEGGGVEENRVVLAKNKLILC